MRKLIGSSFVFALLVPSIVNAQGALLIVTINTPDIPAYLSWVESSAPVMANAFDRAGAIGACVPAQGAEREGNAYWFSTAASHESLFSGDATNPTVANEIAKVESIRDVHNRDLLTVLRAGNALEAGTTWAAWNLLIKTSDPTGYVEAIGDLEAASHDNGFTDITLSAFRYNTGERAGLLMASVSAPKPQRLGALLDALAEPWAAERLTRLNGMREYVHGWTLNCRVYAAHP